MLPSLPSQEVATPIAPTNVKPKATWIQLCAEAILSTRDKRMRLEDICKHIESNHPYYAYGKLPRWRVKYTLSHYRCFVVTCDYYMIHEHYIAAFVNGNYKLTQSRKPVGPLKQAKVEPSQLHNEDTYSDNLKNYECLQRLGGGGYGDVFKAMHTPSKTIRAVKIIKSLKHESARSEFENEVYALRKSSHENIIGFFEYGIGEGSERCAWLATEFVIGVDLWKIMRVTVIPGATAGYICRSVLRGLHYLHTTLRIVHCDVKPSNVLAGENGHVKLADFGLCVKDELQPKPIVGTTLYLAPEVARGETDFSCGVDVWSLGVTLCELITGRTPYHDLRKHKQDLVQAIGAGMPPSSPPPHNIMPTLRDFYDRCCTYDARQRPSAETLLSHPFVTECGNSSHIVDLMHMHARDVNNILAIKY
jgi:serine/threonine protein kinase